MALLSGKDKRIREFVLWILLPYTHQMDPEIGTRTCENAVSLGRTETDAIMAEA